MTPLQKVLKRNTTGDYIPQDFREEAFVGTNDPLSRELYQSARARGYSPEVGNIMADHGVPELGREMQGPMPSGRAGYRERVLPLPVAADRGPMVSDTPVPNWSPRAQLAAAYRDAAHNTTYGNPDVADYQGGELNAREFRRRMGGSGTERERDEGARYSADLKQMLDERMKSRRHELDMQEKVNRGMVGSAAAGRNPVPELNRTELPDGSTALTYGNTLQVMPPGLEDAEFGPLEGGDGYYVKNRNGDFDLELQPKSELERMFEMQQTAKIAKLQADLAGLGDGDGLLGGKARERKRITAELEALMAQGNRTAPGAGVRRLGAGGKQGAQGDGRKWHPQHGWVVQGADGKWYPAGD